MSDMQNLDKLYDRIATLIEQARSRVVKAVNIAEVYTKYSIGQYIVEEEQHGNQRAEYGKEVLKRLSERLTERFGEGWSYSNLRQIRQFYLMYGNLTASGCQIESGIDNRWLSIPNFTEGQQIADNKPSNHPDFVLPWSHYLILMREEDPAARKFYEIEAYRQQWSKHQLQRQVTSSLYERLALSRDKEEVMRLTEEGQTLAKPTDLLKNPVTLEFLGLRPESAYSESKLESAIISKMQQFLLEMGKGFLFEARQKRFTFNEDSYYVDLVLYNRLLQCYVLVDLKTDKLSHQDMGQMQMYVNYYDRYVKEDFEKPTIGILLCKSKEDALVELTLPKDANIYASAYALCLPDKTLLQTKLQEWIEEYNEEKGGEE